MSGLIDYSSAQPLTYPLTDKQGKGELLLKQLANIRSLHNRLFITTRFSQVMLSIPIAALYDYKQRENMNNTKQVPRAF